VGHQHGCSDGHRRTTGVVSDAIFPVTWRLLDRLDGRGLLVQHCIAYACKLSACYDTADDGTDTADAGTDRSTPDEFAAANVDDQPDCDDQPNRRTLAVTGQRRGGFRREPD
jgi:hypothetical protein